MFIFYKSDKIFKIEKSSTLSRRENIFSLAEIFYGFYNENRDKDAEIPLKQSVTEPAPKRYRLFKDMEDNYG